MSTCRTFFFSWKKTSTNPIDLPSAVTEGVNCEQRSEETCRNCPGFFYITVHLVANGWQRESKNFVSDSSSLKPRGGFPQKWRILYILAKMDHPLPTRLSHARRHVLMPSLILKEKKTNNPLKIWMKAAPRTKAVKNHKHYTNCLSEKPRWWQEAATNLHTEEIPVILAHLIKERKIFSDPELDNLWNRKYLNMTHMCSTIIRRLSNIPPLAATSPWYMRWWQKLKHGRKQLSTFPTFKGQGKNKD